MEEHDGVTSPSPSPSPSHSLLEKIDSYAYKGGRATVGKPTPKSPKSNLKGCVVAGGRKRRREEEVKSSYIRATVDGKVVVVSSYFPLPPGATSPVILTKREVRRKIISTPPRTPAQEKEKKMARPKVQSKKNNKSKEPKKKKKRDNKKRSPQLSAAEKRSDAYARVYHDITWVSPAPPSHHNLLQERHSFDPWRVLIICMLLNLTTGNQVKKVLPRLFLLCPDAETTVNVGVEEIEEVIQTLGLQKKRAKMIKRFTQEYLAPDWTHVTQLHGIGKYAADAYAIFCVGKPEEVTPEDHKLVEYWKSICFRGSSTETKATMSAAACNSCSQVVI